MAGVYIHIPFCKQACHYCNFHFVTSLHYKNEMIAALLKEMELRRDYVENESIETLYIGGGTPSLLDESELRSILEKTRQLFRYEKDTEITLEANPDDITEEKLNAWKKAGINRLSIGVQSFFAEDLQWMNRAHSASQAAESLQSAIRHFQNITIDLIYGTPKLTNEKWKYNVEKALSLGIPHLSCYALTVESKTPLDKLIRENKSENIDPNKQSEQFLLLMQWMEEAGYEHYEISNFAKPGWRSRHNTSYWIGKKYLGIGPSAHSFNGNSRQWNISNNNIYMQSIAEDRIPFEKETLTITQQLNEYIMTSLRTMEGIDQDKVGAMAGSLFDINKFSGASQKFIERGLMVQNNNKLMLTRKGKLFADGITAELFF